MTSAKKHDAAVQAWRIARDGAAEAQKALLSARVAAQRGRGTGPMLPEARLALIALEIASLQACDVEAQARSAAQVALEGAEIASGDELTTRRSVVAFAEGLEVRLADEARLEAELVASRKARAGFVLGVERDHAALSARRHAAGLPAPERLPSLECTPHELLAALRTRLAEGHIVPSSEETIRALRNVDTNMRAELEKEIEDRAARDAEHDLARKAKRMNDAQFARRSAKEEAAKADERRSAFAEKLRLAEAHRARSAGA